MNNYNEQLNRSLSENDKKWWGHFFPTYKINWDVSLQDEYNGIDCVINNKKIQLKLRESYWHDILIEFSHTNGEKGWINKSQHCEYIVFGWREKDFIYIFEWDILKRFWEEKQVYLFKKYGKKSIHGAVNKDKITFNFSIPFTELPKHNKIYNGKG
jgi:hypothetical protein